MRRQRIGSVVLLLLLPLFLGADVKESVDKKVVYRGDNVAYTITVTGDDVEFPNITEIGGNPVLSTSGSQNVRIINGHYEKSVSKSYTFAPTATLQVPEYKILVNGGVEMTKPLAIKVVEPSQDKSAPVILDLRLSKKKVHVGEMVRFDLVFKQKPDVPVYKLDIEEPKFEDFWVKKVAEAKDGVEGEYATKTYRYLLFAQKSGELAIPSIAANVGQLDTQRRRGLDPFFDNAFGQQLRYTKVFSNALSLDVTALPDDLELYGDFSIDVKADKTTVAANKPLNLTVTVEGTGNIDDVKKYTLDMGGVVVYANEPKIDARVVGDDYQGRFEQKIVIIADGNYTIPPLRLRYFDPATQQEVLKESAPIAITVTGGVAKAATLQGAADNAVAIAPQSSAPQPERVTPVEVNGNWQNMVYAGLGGFGIGALLVWLLMRRGTEGSKQTEKETPMEQQIKKAKNDKLLFELLLPYKKESAIVDRALAQLEENLYRGGTNRVDTKVLLDHFKGGQKAVELV